MSRFILLLSALVHLGPVVCSQLQKGQIDILKVPRPAHHFQTEYAFDVPVGVDQWTKAKAGLHVAFGSTDELYMRSEVPNITNENTSWEQTGWRGERLNAQILVWSADTIRQIRVKANDLKNASGKVIGKQNMQLNIVRYVLSNYPYGANVLNCGSGSVDTAYLMPDRFEPLDRFDLPGRSVRSVWLSLDIPASTEPGIYNSSIEVSSEHGTVVLNLKVRVQKQILPKPKDWSHRLDLWQNPWVVAWYYQLESWSADHKALLKKHLKLYADAGGKYITTYAVHSPWADNSYMIEGTMIDWVKLKNGSWKFDYSIFDQYVQLAIETGIDKAITIYTPIPWGHRFRYLDEATGNYLYEVWPPDSEKFLRFWNIFLTDLKSHLEKKGWFNKTYLGINENPLDHTLAAIRVIKNHSKSWRITYAGDWHAELTHLLDDYSPILGKEPAMSDIQKRKVVGFSTTYYVCCTPAKPNNFVFSPPVEGRYLGWYTAAYGYDGFLRWAYDAWPQDPMRDARHTLWPAGDCFLVYPGGNSSIRFEKLREGIVDFEKIRILRGLLAKSQNQTGKKSLSELENHLKLFIDDPDYNKRDYNLAKTTQLVKRGKEILESLTDLVDGTSPTARGF